MTSGEVMELRRARGWVSPIAPFELGDSAVMFCQRGTFEVLVHPTDAENYLRTGIMLDGEWLDVDVVDRYPLLNGVLLRARRPAGAAAGFVEACAA